MKMVNKRRGLCGNRGTDMQRDIILFAMEIMKSSSLTTLTIFNKVTIVK